MGRTKDFAILLPLLLSGASSRMCGGLSRESVSVTKSDLDRTSNLTILEKGVKGDFIHHLSCPIS